MAYASLNTQTQNGQKDIIVSSLSVSERVELSLHREQTQS